MYGLLVSLEASKDHTFVIEVRYDVHGCGPILESGNLSFDDWQRMQVAFGLEAYLSKLSMKGAQLFSIYADRLNRMLERFHTINCILDRNKILNVDCYDLVNLADLHSHLLQLEV